MPVATLDPDQLDVYGWEPSLWKKIKGYFGFGKHLLVHSGMIFNNKTVIITGGSEGVGAATARMFADAGANLMLVARNKKNLDLIAEELRDKTRVEVFAMDVADADACVDVFKKAMFEFGRVDILVNNAGYHERGPVAEGRCCRSRQDDRRQS